ncbi:MAG: hypothetical protein KC609_17790, partial [Myxococcales bacterium]|nr:hypothetical protein [Myxococcales bacterium]
MRGFRAIARVGLVLSVALATIACGGTKKKVGQLCQNDSTCPSGSLCVAGECVTLQACQSTSECEAGVCSEGYCWTEACSADRPCADSLQCLDGYCVRRAETQDASDTSSEDQSVTPDQGQEKQCDLDADCADKVGQLGQCEEAWCNAGQCQKRNKTSGASCDDGNKCTSGDQCDDAGSCQPGSNICECEKDGDCTQLTDACNTGVCNPTTNKCVKQPANEGKSCDDGTFCMVGEVCVNGTCGGNPEHKLRTDCGLNGATDQCNTARCDTVSDKCVVDPINEGNPCDDGNVCTVSDSCKSGVCAGDPLFGSSCGSGVGEHCDFYGQCVSWVETRLAPPTYSTNVACLAATDCPDGGNGYSCENGMCVCTNGAGCVC